MIVKNWNFDESSANTQADNRFLTGSIDNEKLNDELLYFKSIIQNDIIYSMKF